MDYLIMSYIHFFYSIQLPYVCGTEIFLNITVLTKILRGSGGFFINRDKLKDPLYKTIVAEYFQILLGKKITIEHFIEMERSKSGKTRRAKDKILKYIFNSYFNNPTQKIVFCPVTNNYDRVHEGESFPTKLLGEEVNAYSFKDSLKGLHLSAQEFGKAVIRFCDPIPINKFVENYCTSMGIKLDDLQKSTKAQKACRKVFLTEM